MKITMYENGPNQVELESGYRYRGADGAEEVVDQTSVFLCRCGHSEKKPFCDGTHKKIGFEAPGGEIEIAG